MKEVHEEHVWIMCGHLLVGATRSHRDVYGLNVAFLYNRCLSRECYLIALLHSPQRSVTMKIRTQRQMIENYMDVVELRWLICYLIYCIALPGC